MSGAWFITAICKVFATQAWNKDLEEMLRIVDIQVGERETRGHDAGERQTTEMTRRGFNKKLFFNPGFRRCQKCPLVDKEEAIAAHELVCGAERSDPCRD